MFAMDRRPCTFCGQQRTPTVVLLNQNLYVFMHPPAVSRRRHSVLGLSVRLSMREHILKVCDVNTISYKPLVGVSSTLQLKCSWNARLWNTFPSVTLRVTTNDHGPNLQSILRLIVNWAPATYSLGDICRHIYLEPRNHGAL